MLRLGLVPIVRPLFRGAHMGLQETSRQGLVALGPRLGFEVTYAADPVGDLEQAGEAARAIDARRRAGALDLVLIEHITFATGDLITPFLEIPLPLGIWALPEATSHGPLPQNALCGLNLSLSLPSPRTVPVKWFYGSADEAGFQTRLGVTVQALRGMRAVRDARLLWVGGTAPGFYRLESLPDLPLHIDRLPLDAVYDALEGVSDLEAGDRLAAYDEPTAIVRDDLRATARLEAALEHLAEGYDGVALRCWPELPDAVRSMACAPYGRLADRGCAFACEGDAAGLVSMLAVAAVSGHPAALLDVSHVDGGGLMFWHCGNAGRAWARDGQTRLTRHFNRGIAAVREMRLAPGPVSGLRFLEDRQAVVYAGEVLDRPDGFDGVSGWIGRLRWAGREATPQAFLASVLNHRLPHHLVWGLGDAEPALLELCGWLGHRPLELDPESVRLRWST
jgi:L-fucose isomerase-like protein